MFRSKIKIVSLVITPLIFAPFLVLSGAFVYYAPNAPVSLAVFENTYDFFPFKKSFLEFYSPAGRNYGVNTRTDVNVSKFLLQRIETTNDESEVAAIAHFYALQAKGRSYDIFINVSDRVKPIIINQLVKELGDNSSRLSDRIMLLETTRTGKRIGKGSIWIEDGNIPDFHQSFTMEQRAELFNERLAATGAIRKYQEWWNSNLSWEEKKKISPLEGTKIKVSECCG